MKKICQVKTFILQYLVAKIKRKMTEEKFLWDVGNKSP